MSSLIEANSHGVEVFVKGNGIDLIIVVVLLHFPIIKPKLYEFIICRNRHDSSIKIYFELLFISGFLTCKKT